jgi:tetratricopeptide (TPR) repeat protein
MGAYSDETDVDQLCDQGDVEHEARRWTQASTHYERALEFGAAQLSPERHIYVRMALALCFFYSGSYEDAVKYDRATLRILEAGPEYGTNHKDAVDTRYRLARALVDSASKSDRKRSEKWEEAVTFYKKNIRVADKEASLEARKGLASVCVKLRRYSEAKDIYEQLLNEEEPNFLDGKDDESLELKHEYAAVQYHLKRYDQSKRLFSQIEETISSLPVSRKRNLGKLSQGVDKYLAACFEATLDLDRGVARSVAASKERKDYTPALVKQSPAKVAPNHPRRSSPAPVAAGEKTSGSRPHDGPNDDAAASVNTRRRTSISSEKPQKDSNDTVSSTGKRFPKTDSSLPLAGPSKSTPNLSVPSSAAPKKRRSSSDHSVTRSREAIKSEVPVARSISEHSPSRSKYAAKSEPISKSAVKLRPKSKDASDSESKPKPMPSLRPKQISKVTDSSDSESRTPQSKPRSISETKPSRFASESTRPSSSKSGSSHSPSNSIPPLDSRTKSSHSASESTTSSSSKTQSSNTAPTSGSGSISSDSPKGPSDSRPRSSRPTPSSSSESNRKPVASTNLEHANSNDGLSHKEDLRETPGSIRTSEPHRSRSVSAPSTSRTSSAKSAGAIGSPDPPLQHSRPKAKVPQVVISKPSITFQVPGSWPEDSSSLATDVQESKELVPLELKDRRRSLGEDTVASLASSGDVPKLERSRSESYAPSETGKLYALPNGAPEVDNWFRGAQEPRPQTRSRCNS